MMNAEVDTAGIERNIRALQAPQLKRTAMTYAQKLHQQGRQEGELKGRLAAQRENVLEALEIRDLATYETSSNSQSAVSLAHPGSDQ